MNVLDQLRRLSSAEDFFNFLDITYDPVVLDVMRLHILKRMGEYLQKNEKPLAQADEQTARALCRAHLERAYRDFIESTPLDERVFKVLKDAVKPPATPLIQLSTAPNGQA
ncbi:MAG: nitrogenase stabilizing/protective protein NifW [Vulcanimicrobiaceae bacterium]|jgi:nitrogenase-stabilizing/protective protein